MSAATTFTTKNGERRAELISLDDRPTWKVTDPRGKSMGRDVLQFIPARTITQMRKINGSIQPVTLLAPVTLHKLHQAGITQQDLEAWGLVLPPARSEVPAS